MERDLDGLVCEQLDYYRARAGEYDEWFLRQGRYDRGEESNRRWFDETGRVRAALAAELAALPRDARILELASGTGIWTEHLARVGHVTAIDASPEVTERCRARLAAAGLGDRVEHQIQDLFTWQPTARWHFVFFGFWLSHVPPDRATAFFEMLGRALEPGGRFFFVDTRFEGGATARDQKLGARDDVTVRRRLNDGREFEIVKVFYDAEELGARLRASGLAAEVRVTERFLLYGAGENAAGNAP